METLEDPKTPEKYYDWRCRNDKCEALMRATIRDGVATTPESYPNRQIYFNCPHCGWGAMVEA